MSAARDRTVRWRRAWDKQARTYDKQMRFMDRVLFGDSRSWACSQATGEVLEVAVGTGLNLTEYPDEVALTGIDFSDEMLGIARARAAELDRGARLLQGDAHSLPFADATFDTVVCTFGLCAIPDIDVAVAEMHRVLRPAGRLVLVDHVESSASLARAVQRLLEFVTVPTAGEHFLRRPLNEVRTAGFSVERTERFKLGVVERLTARKPSGL
ncbi:ubiquinone/menaquinone biosynthesis C-methylase UbiE [Saccharopolyspora lacisalsi]|uniref:Ubiquinone/menaquinone biosynthesis C-methylase UbiE n=1 Tax=Halosaccharopolyspora lacisalsi TaxID=1000566 RepID=A0A839DQK1_9PSEU|nr:methyltransferase domain-containing protein [Halosaccharopolyspora lacisalsi]MBA8824262.1 ubiquinone/menaquinone biosynthesis C-methylase UbiE [Halosaccharopolyspora lacisalsi]